MEERPLFSKSEDDDEENDDQPKKKQSLFAELISKDERSKEETSKDIARSIFGDKKPETDDVDEPETSPDEPEMQGEELSEDEALIINQEIAEEHLANPVVNEQPAPPVIEFLELIVNGAEPEAAYGATKTEYNLEEDSLPETDETTADSSPTSETVERPIGVDTTSADQAPNVYKTANTTEAKPRPVATKVASKIASSIAKRRVVSANSSTPKAETQANERRLERQVAFLEARLTKREQTLQSLSEQQPATLANVANNNPFERMQPGLSESRLNLIKPERAGHIGRMAVSKERTGAERHKPSINTDPDQVKSMRREDLLALSANLKVQGASLKHMFENNLFSEAALRRMVEAHLRGRDMLPLLRREILDRQNDFERDPRLRNRQPSAGGGDELFDQMLVAVDNKLPAQAPHTVNQSAPNTSYPLANSPLVPIKQEGMPVANAVLGITIALLVGLILFFAFR